MTGCGHEFGGPRSARARSLSSGKTRPHVSTRPPAVGAEATPLPHPYPATVLSLSRGLAGVEGVSAAADKVHGIRRATVVRGTAEFPGSRVIQ
jgi:hypothetical protein